MVVQSCNRYSRYFRPGEHYKILHVSVVQSYVSSRIDKSTITNSLPLSIRTCAFDRVMGSGNAVA